MTAPAILVVAAFTLLAGVAAAWFTVLRPPEHDVGLWVRVWMARLGVPVGWHPLGRWSERKVAHPTVASMPGALREGENALLAELASLPDAEARWGVLLGHPTDVLLADDVLSRDHDPARWLGPSVDPSDPAAVAREAERRAGARWVVVTGEDRGTPDVTGAFEDAIRLPWNPGGVEAEGAPEALLEALTEALPDDPSVRWMVLATGEGAWSVVRALSDGIALRDRLLAVVSVGGVVGGLPDVEGPLSEAACEDWMAHHFRHESLDTEVVRWTAWWSLQWVDPAHDPPGAAGVPIARARWPEPGFVGREPPFLDVVDLGVFPVTGTDAPALGAVLRAVAGLRALALDGG